MNLFLNDLKPHSKRSSKNELSFNSSSKQVLNKQKTAAEQVMVPSINNSNQSNNSNELNSNKQAKYNKKNITSFDNNSTAEKEESCAKEEKENQKALSYFNPTRDEVLDYFEKQTFPSIEGNKFYNYFSSIGWLVGGKTPMVNWQSAAENWMLNTQKFAGISIPINHLGTSIHKNYSEPL